jgi:quinolinate synthase
MENQLILEEIKRLKAERNAVILSHFYTRREVQEVADFVGDFVKPQLIQKLMS